METSDKQKEEWGRVVCRKKNGDTSNGDQKIVKRRMDKQIDKQKEDWRLVISRKKNGDE